MGFSASIKSGFSNYFNFSGRASRSEYWYWNLFVVLISIIETVVGGTGIITMLVLFIPGLAVFWRRMHDLDKSGAWFFIFLTVIGVLVLLVWACIKGTSGANRFGPDSLGSDDPAPPSDPAPPAAPDEPTSQA